MARRSSQRRNTYRRNRAREAELRQLIDAGCVAGALVLQGFVEAEFAMTNDGYKHGEFATPAAAIIEISNPYTRDGVRRVDVFTAAVRDADGEDIPYPGMWEFGHHNRWTGKHEREPKFGPAAEKAADAVGGAMIRQVKLGLRRMPNTGKREVTPRSGRLETGINLREWGL